MGNLTGFGHMPGRCKQIRGPAFIAEHLEGGVRPDGYCIFRTCRDATEGFFDASCAEAELFVDDPRFTRALPIHLVRTDLHALSAVVTGCADGETVLA
jgi:hypothetical protein